MNNKKVAIYPFDIESAPLVRYKEYLRSYDLMGVFSPRGWGINKDISMVDGGEKGLTIETDLINSVINYDTLIINQPCRTLDFNKNVLPLIISKIQEKKEIILNWYENESFIKELCERLSVPCSVMSYDRNLFVNHNKLMDITVPIVFVCGFTEMANKFFTQLTLREYFTKEGYNISQIGTKKYSELFGFKSFPAFMFESISDSEKIILFNNYVKQIEIEERPDLIIIGIPGSVIPFNNRYNYHFGSFANIISHSIEADAIIANILYGDYNQKIFDLKRNIMKYKYGWNVDCFSMSNFYVDLTSTLPDGELQFSKVGSELLDGKIESTLKSVNNINIFNSLNDTHKFTMCKMIEDKLLSYGTTRIM
ncbi:TIGR04066 family peptide maturation system protein [Paenibacillus donghaensis]|uniref:TIGR04066 family peptide maturation system protein n=1 Tax=Paenibacillus donghaensis TaxID=414771 RepID=A0A2Z2KLW3_9BACL|nr:TIGR04066 family peptide maturation system protein [Paenibacillus donghaensis]ASA25345.1 TIGR04066 family peptide maturation system protein [Paenibacillus donghaensis]